MPSPGVRVVKRLIPHYETAFKKGVRMRQFIFSVLVVFISTGLAWAEKPGNLLLQISHQARFSRDTVAVDFSAERETLWGLERSQDAEPSVEKGKGKNIPLIVGGLALVLMGTAMAADAEKTETFTDIFGNESTITATDNNQIAVGLFMVLGGGIMTLKGF